ncbi:polyketide cyclase [Antarcticibacterium arcticum]|uniref:Polyketide cyclase n=1 Tax=Antarcticibacterium arcticum TaxID=2585771 RepID=A0A5B8YMH0_9FLAO|nr:SRPBCC family protein [Antarcticibacterium arcticum]QED36959.1 polyketide cyclase [Antarcticibacterium arcticum]
MEPHKITVETKVNAPIEKVWKYWTDPEHVTKWNSASPDWHCPRATNDVKNKGKFSYRMEAKDKSVGFDMDGVYTQVEKHKKIAYSMDDERKVEILFIPNENSTRIIETFEAENTFPHEQQQQGWQSILDNFKNHVEKN